MDSLWQKSVIKFFCAVVVFGALSNSALASEPTQIVQGERLYSLHCARCHGKKLEGQPDWKSPLPNGRMPAPPHDKTGHTWHHTDSALAGITKLGLKPFAGDKYESDMPAFGKILSDVEIEAILSYIKRTWPDRERGYQQQMTQQSQSTPTLRRTAYPA